MSKRISSSLQQCKNYKNRSRISKVMINNVLPPFLWFTVYLLDIYSHEGAAWALHVVKDVDINVAVTIETAQSTWRIVSFLYLCYIVVGMKWQ